MKKVAVILLAVFSTAAFAYGPGHGHKGGERMVEHMSEKLDLSEEQSAQMKVIFE